MTKTKRPLELTTMTRASLKAAMHAMNWRKHERYQLDAIRESIERNGWAKACLYNRQTGRLINGHGRVLADGPDDEEIPVLQGSWTEEQEKYLLATLDPIGGMADADFERLETLLPEVAEELERNSGLLMIVAKQAEKYAVELELLEEMAYESAGDSGLSEMVGGDLPESQTQMLQLFYSQPDYERFQACLDRLRNDAEGFADKSVAGVLVVASEMLVEHYEGGDETR